jgi:hypothetical protein
LESESAVVVVATMSFVDFLPFGLPSFSAHSHLAIGFWVFSEWIWVPVVAVVFPSFLAAVVNWPNW